MDPLMGMGLVILGSKDILNRLLGPSAGYLGGELKDIFQKCNINLDSIFEKATKKLGNKMEEKGMVSPRVLKDVINEGRFCEDELTSEYYGGILASSRTATGRDDRGVSHLAVLRNLSTYQIRLHYLFYFLVYRLFKNSDLNIGMDEDRRKMRIHIPYSTYNAAMEFSKDEDAMYVLSHCINGFIRHDLLDDDYYWYGGIEHMRKRLPGATEGGMIFEPTAYGAELFLWAQGLSDKTHRNIMKPNVDLGNPLIRIIEGATKFGK